MNTQATMKEGDKVMMHGEECEVISTYSRAEAIRDGVLVDLTEMAKEAGWRFPVALTQAVWAEYVAVPANVECQDEKGRAWDIVYMSIVAVKAANSRGKGGSTLMFELHVRNDNKKPKPTRRRTNSTTLPPQTSCWPSSMATLSSTRAMARALAEILTVSPQVPPSLAWSANRNTQLWSRPSPSFRGFPIWPLHPFAAQESPASCGAFLWL